MASATESMPAPPTLPSPSPSPVSDQAAYRPSSRSGSHSHPYAIVTSSSALLTRSNSTGHGKASHSYTPASPSSSSRIVTNPHNRGHRHAKSLSNVMPPPPLPIPPSPSAPSRFADYWSGGGDEEDAPKPRRSETMPSFLPTSPGNDEIKISDLPDNPKLWTPRQLSVYLSCALRVKGSDKLPAPIAKDIGAFIVKEHINGRVFLRLKEEDLEEKGINKLWRNALLSAARSLRKKVLKGRIWGFGSSPPPEAEQRRPSTVHEQEDETPETPEKPRGGYRRGRVRGMVESFERSSSSSGSSAGQRSPIEPDAGDQLDSESDDQAIRNELSAAGWWESDSQDEDPGFTSGELESPVASESAFVFPPLEGQKGKAAGGVLDTPSEPTMEELLAQEAQSKENESTWGARAWEADMDPTGGGTARRVVDTIQPSSRKSSSKRLKGSRPSTIKGVPLADVFDTPEQAPESVPIIAPPSLPGTSQREAASDTTTQQLIEGLRARVEEVERRLAEVERREEERQQALVEATRDAAPGAGSEGSRNGLQSLPSFISLVPHTLGLVFPRLVDRLSSRSPSASPRIPPENISDGTQLSSKRKRPQDPDDQSTDLTPAALPQYVLLVGLGVCAVILRVLIRKVSGKR